MAAPLDTILIPPVSARRFVATVLYANRGSRAAPDVDTVLDSMSTEKKRFCEETHWDLTTMRFAAAHMSRLLGRTVVLYDPSKSRRWVPLRVGSRIPVFIYVDVGDSSDAEDCE